MTIKIKQLQLQGRTVLAPLAGITNLPFRSMVKTCGCALVCSEMVSAKGLIYQSTPTFRLLESIPEERPLSIQLFGADPKDMARAAKMVEKQGSADVLDINFGCSVKKVVKTGAGVALMKEPALAEAIIKAVRDAVSLPFTIKIRSGWDSSGDQALEIAQIAQRNGVDAVAVHPRTALQGFRGSADWTLIKKIKTIISIPVIGNGDIRIPEDGVRMINSTGCDAVMVGRAAMGNPFIFAGIDALLEGRCYRGPLPGDGFNFMRGLTRAYVEYFGEGPACRLLRGRLAWFVKGLPDCSTFRRTLSGIRSMTEALKLIDTYEKTLMENL